MRAKKQTLSTSHVLRTLLATGALAAISTPALAVDSTWTGNGVGDNWFTPLNWDTDPTVPNGAGDTALIGAPAPVLMDGSVILKSLTVTADGILTTGISTSLDVDGDPINSFVNNAGLITVGNNSDFRILNTVTNSGTINIASLGFQSDLEIGDGGATLTGGGEVVLSGTLAGINDISGVQTLTIADQTIRGKGNIGRNDMNFVNQINGLIDADDAGGGILQIDPITGLVNAGTLRASNGGKLQLNSGAYDNTGGIIEALAGSTVTTNISSVTDFAGGTVRSIGDGMVQTGISSNATFLDTTFEGMIIAGNNSDFGIGGTINNTGTIEIASTGNQTDLEIQVGGATLTGGGEVVLSGTLAGIDDISGTQTLTIADQTIRGKGNIGRNTMDFVNQANGLIDADVSGGILVIDPAATLINTGTLRASNGGELQLNTGDFDNTGGVIEALEGSTVTTGTATVNTFTGGTIRSVGTGIVQTGISSNTTFFGTNFEGTLVAGNNSDFGIGGTINNTGTIEIASTGSQTDLEIQVGGATLTGGGEVVLSGSLAGIDDISGIQTLTIADQTIRGKGNIGRNTMDFVNQANGLIDADVSGGILVIDPAATLTNTGTLRASNGGELQLNMGDFDNTGGVIEALEGSTVTTTNSASSTITGGTVRSVGTGIVQTGISSNTTFFGTNFEGTLVAGNNSDFGIGGTINNTGTIEIASTGNQTDLEIQVGGATLTGGGEVVLSGTLAGIDDISGTQTLTIADQTISGRGNIGRNTMDFVNQAGGVIKADDNSGTLVIDPQNTFTNAGTLQASSGGTLQLNAGTYDHTGIMVAMTNSVVTSSAGATINQLVENGSDDAINGGEYRAFNGTLNVAQANFDARFNSGNLNFFGNSAQTNLFDESASSAGNIVSQVFSFNDGSVFVQGGADLTTNVETFNNVGTVNIYGSSIFAVNNGGSNGTFINGSPSTLGGTGTLQADLVNDFTGALAPGINDDPGTLTIDGDAVLGINGTYRVDIAGTNDSDLLAVLGSLSLDGTLDIDLDGSFTPADGEQFLIATATPGTITGDFATITDNSAVYDFFSVINNDTGEVFIQAVPEPSSLALLGIAGLGLLRRRR